MLCSVQWSIGEKETTWGSFSLAEGELGFGLGPVAGDDLGGGPVVVVGDQDVLAEDLFFQGGAGGGVDAPGQAEVFGVVAGQLPGDDAADPGRCAGSWRSRLRPCRVAAAGLAAGQGGGQLVRACGRPWPGWCRRSRGPAWRAARVSGSGSPGARRRRPRGGCRRRSARRSGPRSTTARALAGRASRSGQSRGGHRPDVAQPGPGQVGEVGLGVLPGVEDHGHLGGSLAAGGADRRVPGGQLSIMAGNWVTSGLSPG